MKTVLSRLSLCWVLAALLTTSPGPADAQVFPFLKPAVESGPNDNAAWLYERQGPCSGCATPFDLVGVLGPSPADPAWNIHAINVPLIWEDPDWDPGWGNNGWSSASPGGHAFIGVQDGVVSKRVTFILNTLGTGSSYCGEFDLNIEPNQPLYHPGLNPGWLPQASIPPLGLLDALLLEGTFRLPLETGGTGCAGITPSYRALVLGVHFHNTTDPTNKDLGLFYQLSIYDSRGDETEIRPIREFTGPHNSDDGFALVERIGVHGHTMLVPGAGLDRSYTINVGPRLRAAIQGAATQSTNPAWDEDDNAQDLSLDTNPAHYRADAFYVSAVTNGESFLWADATDLNVYGRIDGCP